MNPDFLSLSSDDVTALVTDMLNAANATGALTGKVRLKVFPDAKSIPKSK